MEAGTRSVRTLFAMTLKIKMRLCQVFMSYDQVYIEDKSLISEDLIDPRFGVLIKGQLVSIKIRSISLRK